MKRTSRVSAGGALLLSAGSAAAAARLLAPRPAAPEPARVDMADHFSQAEIQRGRRFARPQLAIGLLRSGVELGVLVALVRRPPGLLRSGRRPPPAVAGALAGAALSAALSLPALPLSALARRRAIAVGLVTQSWRGWAIDLAKASAIETAMAALGGAAVVSASRRWPQGWWLPAAGGSVLAGGALAALAPVVLDPIFNDFTPLPEAEVRSDVLALADAAGVRVGEVYSVDASRRTTAANAYVTGLGPTKRVVLFDTLLDRYSPEEVRVVVAHELSHVRRRDVWRSILFAALVAPPAALAVERLSAALGAEPGEASSLPALALAAVAVGGPLGLLANGLSRAVERRADAESLELTGSPEAFISFERAIALQNVADLAPPRWVSRLLSTHPPTAERIGAAVAFARTCDRRGAPASAAPA